MRELVVENQEVLIIPKDFKNVNRGIVKEVTAEDFVLELESEPNNILVNTYCEFYTQTSHGKLNFESYAKIIDGNKLTIASPNKHKFLQRRQYRRVKYLNTLMLKQGDNEFEISTKDISAGGMKFTTSTKVDIDEKYNVTVKLNANIVINCEFLPIRIEKSTENAYIVSGQFVYTSSRDRMLLTQYCVKRGIEINNK